MKRKIILKVVFIVILVFTFGFQTAIAVTPVTDKAENTSFKVETNQIKDDEAEIINRFSLRDKFQRSPEAQIRSFYKDFNKFSQKNEIDKLKSLYSDSYVNNDGFNKTTIFEMMMQASEAYKDIEYVTTIEKIEVDGNYAAVDVHEFAIGSTAKKQEEINDYGLVSSDIYYTDYLKKEGNKWKISATNVKSEKVALKYGETKSMPIEIIAPKLIPANSEYDVKIKTQSPNGVLVIGSIVNEQIVYPQVQKKDVFKSVKSGVLERILKSNNENHNEYVAVTLGVTRASIEPPQVVFNMTGMAFIMSRVNVYKQDEKSNVEKIINKKEEANNDKVSG